MGVRELDLVQDYTGHFADMVLGVYYAKARMYDAGDRRFMAVDPVRGGISQPMTLAQYTYVLDNPIKYIDPTGEFLKGTVMTKGAQGSNVAMLQEALMKAGYLSPAPANHGSRSYNMSDVALAQELSSNTLGDNTIKAIEAYLSDYAKNSLANNPPNLNDPVLQKALSGNTDVDCAIWTSLGLKVNMWLEQEFFSGTRGNGVISVTIKGNDVVIEYNPTVYITEAHVGYGIDYLGEEFSYVYYLAISQDDYKKYLTRIVSGIEQWSKNGVDIQGVTANFTIKVSATKASSKFDADIYMIIGSTNRAYVPTTVIWNTGIEPFTYLYYPDKNSPQTYTDRGITGDEFAAISAHEFGHVLGIYDAYVNGWLNPVAASSDRAPVGSIMTDTQWANRGYTNNEYEMLLYAWSRNKLQTYNIWSPFGEESQAFFN